MAVYKIGGQTVTDPEIIRALDKMMTQRLENPCPLTDTSPEASGCYTDSGTFAFALRNNTYPPDLLNDYEITDWKEADGLVNPKASEYFVTDEDLDQINCWLSEGNKLSADELRYLAEALLKQLGQGQSDGFKGVSVGKGTRTLPGSLEELGFSVREREYDGEIPTLKGQTVDVLKTRFFVPGTYETFKPPTAEFDTFVEKDGRIITGALTFSRIDVAISGDLTYVSVHSGGWSFNLDFIISPEMGLARVRVWTNGILHNTYILSDSPGEDAHYKRRTE